MPSTLVVTRTGATSRMRPEAEAAVVVFDAGPCAKPMNVNVVKAPFDVESPVTLAVPIVQGAP